MLTPGEQGSLLTARPFDPFSRAGCAFPRRPLGRHRRLAAARRTQRRTAPVRPDPIPTEALIRHWTCCNDVVGDTLMLFDSSIEPGALHQLPREPYSDPRTTAPARFSSSRTPSDSSARGFKAEKDDSRVFTLQCIRAKGSDSGNAAGKSLSTKNEKR